MALGSGSVEKVRSQLQELLASEAEELSVADVLRLFDSDGMHLIDWGEFENTMRSRFGYDGDAAVLRQIFEECDKDGSGRIGYDELYRFIRGKDIAKDQSKISDKIVRHLTLQPKPEELGRLGAADLNWSDAHGMRLQYDVSHTWSQDDLRLEIQVLLIGNEISPADWLRAWDRDSNVELSKTEFLSNFKRMFMFGEGDFGSRLWEQCVRATAAKTFDALAGSDKSLSIPEFESFLDANWMGMKRAQDRRRLGVLKQPGDDGTPPASPNAVGRKGGSRGPKAAARPSVLQDFRATVAHEEAGVEQLATAGGASSGYGDAVGTGRVGRRSRMRLEDAPSRTCPCPAVFCSSP